MKGEQTGTTCFHAKQDINGFIRGGKTGCYVGDEGGALFVGALRKGLFDVIHGKIVKGLGGIDWQEEWREKWRVKTVVEVGVF